MKKTPKNLVNLNNDPQKIIDILVTDLLEHTRNSDKDIVSRSNILWNLLNGRMKERISYITFAAIVDLLKDPKYN